MFGAHTTNGITDLLGDPGLLAEDQFHLARNLCGACRDYHAVWPYKRLSRMVSGIEANADIIEAVLRQATPPTGRILVAGAADAGLLALTARALEGLTPRIDVADRCPTPLHSCRRYAQKQRQPIATIETDLGTALLPSRYDVVFGDCILQFVPQLLRVAFLRNLREAMTEHGTIVLVERLYKTLHGDYAGETISALAAQQIKLPENEAAFRLRLNRTVEEQRARIRDYSTVNDLEPALIAAGFRIDELTDCRGNRTALLVDGQSVSMKILVARRVP